MKKFTEYQNSKQNANEINEAMKTITLSKANAGKVLTELHNIAMKVHNSKLSLGNHFNNESLKPLAVLSEYISKVQSDSIMKIAVKQEESHDVNFEFLATETKKEFAALKTALKEMGKMIAATEKDVLSSLKKIK